MNLTKHHGSYASEMTGTTSWLQLFAAPGAPDPTPASAPASTPTPTTSAATAPAAPATPTTPSTPTTQTTPTAPGAAPAPTATTQPAPTAPPATPTPPAQPEVLDFGGRRVTVPSDPAAAAALRAVYKDFQRQQAELTRKQQELASVRQQTPAPTPTPQTTPQQPVQQTPSVQQMIAALDPAERQQFNERFMEDPVGAMEGLMQKWLAPMVEQRVQSVQQQLQAQQAFIQQQQEMARAQAELQEMYANPAEYPDLDVMVPVMTQVAQMYPEVGKGPGGMERLYRMAKGYAASVQPAPQPVTIETVKSDQNLLHQILSDPSIRETIIRSYLEDLKAGKPPITIGPSGGGGVTPVTPPNVPRTTADATRNLLARLGIPQQ